MASHPKARVRNPAIAEELRPILELPIVGVVLWDASGRILDANDRFLEITGYTREDLAKGLDVRRLTPSEWHPTDEKAISEMGERGPPRTSRRSTSPSRAGASTCNTTPWRSRAPKGSSSRWWWM